MRVITSKSKNAESFYISKGYINDKGVSTSVIVRKLGTLKDLLPEHGPTRDDVMAWAKEEARLEKSRSSKADKSKDIDNIDDEETVTITANSIEELMNKISDYTFAERSDSVQTDTEKMVGQHVDFRG